MRNNWGGTVVLTESCSTLPGCVRQVNGVAVGMSVGGGVREGTDVGGIAVGVGSGLLDGEQAEFTSRNKGIRIMRRRVIKVLS